MEKAIFSQSDDSAELIDNQHRIHGCVVIFGIFCSHEDPVAARRRFVTRRCRSLCLTPS